MPPDLAAGFVASGGSGEVYGGRAAATNGGRWFLLAVEAVGG
jgi:hypothetical protein